MFAICLLLWILFNGRITLEIVIFGVVISGAVFSLCCMLFDYSMAKEKALLTSLPGMLKLLWILLAEVYKANLAVLKLVYSKNTFEPAYIEFDAPLKSTAARVALADCITLTPGTITGKLEGGHYTVHCLDRSMADGIEDSIFVRQLQKLEKELMK